MNGEWLKIVFASIFEVLWVIGLKYAEGFWEWSGTIFTIGISFYFLIMAGEKLPPGTVYAVSTGLGTLGTVGVGYFFFHESISGVQVFFLLLLCIGIIGLKQSMNQTKEQEESTWHGES